jgi:YggT family protein
MGVSASSPLLFSTASSINRFIDDFIWVYVLLILAYIITSWVRLPYSPWLRRIQDFLRDVCEPYLRLFRRLLPSFGPLDFSPVIAVFFLFLLMRLVDAVFGRFD